MTAVMEVEDVLKSMSWANEMSNVRRRIIHDNGTMETDAEHTYRMLHLLSLLSDELMQERVFCLPRVYELILIHDLPETIAGDTWYQDKVGRVFKKDLEDKAAMVIFNAKQMSLWEEFEAQVSYESQIAKKLDHLQAVITVVMNHGTTWKTNLITKDVELEYSKDILAKDDILGNLLNEVFEYADSRDMFHKDK